MSKDALNVLVAARKQDKYVEWGMLMTSCELLSMSRVYLHKLETNGLATVIREENLVKVILTAKGYAHAQLFLESKGN